MGRYDILLNTDKDQRGHKAAKASQAVAQRSPLGGVNEAPPPADQTPEQPGKAEHLDMQQPVRPATSASTKDVAARGGHLRVEHVETQAHDQAPSIPSPMPPALPSGVGISRGIQRSQTGRVEMAPATEPRNHGTTEPRQPQQPGEAATTTPAFRFDASAKADQKYTLAFTDQELEALEDVKLELRRRYDVRTSKTELVRCALWDLIEDYLCHGEHSRLLQRMRARSQRTTDSKRTTE